MNTCCCGNCTTIFKLDAALKVQWFRNFYFDYDFTKVDPFGSNSFGNRLVFQCDVDLDGNVYQVGDSSGHVLQAFGYTLLDQTTPLYTLRSWDSAGNLRWSWSDAEYGTTISGPGRLPPVRLTSCRVAPNTVTDYGLSSPYSPYSSYGGGTPQMILVGTDDSAGLTGSAVGGPTKVTALDTDGNPMWSVSLGRWTARCHSTGATRSLWRITGEIFSGDNIVYPLSGGWLILRNSDGAVLFTSLTDPHWTGLSVAAIDKDDLVYEMAANYLHWGESSNSAALTTVTRYSADGSVVDWSVCSPYMSGGQFNGNIFLGSPAANAGYDIAVEGSTLIVSTRAAFERFTKNDGGHVSIRRTPLTKLFFSDAEAIAAMTGLEDYTYSSQQTLGVFTPAGDRNKLWDGNTVADARRTPDGGMVLSVQRNCPTLGGSAGEMITDMNQGIISCSSHASFTAVSTETYGYANIIGNTGRGYTMWAADDGCSAGCKSLSVDLVAQISNTYAQQGGFVGYQFFAGVPVGNVAANMAGNVNLQTGQPAIAAPAAGDVVSFDCF